MADDHAPEDFDWVTAQSTCRPETMFARLLAGVKTDVERRNALLTPVETWRFEVEEDVDRFEVARAVPSGFDESRVVALVIFEREGSRLHIHGDQVDVEFTAVVMLDDTGTCRFVVGEAQYAEWQLRKLALAELFFEEAI